MHSTEAAIMDFLNVSVDETQCAALRGRSVDSQRRDRKRGIGPKAFTPPGSNKPRYFLKDIEAERAARINEVENA
jgi:hypothetical protein